MHRMDRYIRDINNRNYHYLALGLAHYAKPGWQMTKYSARRTTRDGISFDSKAEARRYGELRLAEMAGEITGLETHPRFVLQPAFRRNGKAVKAIIYEADFAYTDTVTGKRIIEDVKGYQGNQLFLLKQKMFWYRYPELDLRIVEA